MPFGRPPNIFIFSPTPPEKESFPLDHEGNYINKYFLYNLCNLNMTTLFKNY